MEGSSGYNVLLLGIVNNNNEGELIRVAAAIAFKNSVKRNWRIVSQLEVQLKDLKLFFFNVLCISKTEGFSFIKLLFEQHNTACNKIRDWCT